MKRTAGIILFLLFFVTAATAEEYTFRKTKWGMSKADVIKSEDKEPAKEKEDWIGYKDTVAGMPCLIFYNFTDNKLSRAKYSFIQKNTNKNDYIRDYKMLKDSLTKKYGKPDQDEEIWKNSLYRDDYEQHGFAVSVGHLTYLAVWETESTKVMAGLYGNNYEIHLLIEYHVYALPSAAEVPGFHLVYDNGQKELIPFGAHYDDVLKTLKQKYRRSELTKLSTFIVIKEFKVGVIPYEIVLAFTEGKEFSEYYFRSEKFTANKLDPLVYGIGFNLTGVFKEKFGEPAKCYSQTPSILEIKENYETTLCKWESAGNRIYTAISKINFKYFVTGHVIAESIANKAKQEEYEEIKSETKDAAESF